MASPLILIANPGSASRKYALYEGEQRRAMLHLEMVGDRVVGTLWREGRPHELVVNVPSLDDATRQLPDILTSNHLLSEAEHIERIGLRIVAPSSFFLQDHLITDEVLQKLHDTLPRAPLHIGPILKELEVLRQHFPHTPIAGISDSAFHATKPDYAWNYGLPLPDADRLDIKRFGYHGLSVASIVATLHRAKKLPPRLIVCHLGSGASVTAVKDGESLDTTMGYSPLEGLIMATRSGSIDPMATLALKDFLALDDEGLEAYLNTKGGLLGLGGSADLRELLRRVIKDDTRARLAIQTYILNIQKAIGQMSAALGGVDALVFTGTVGERSIPVRHLVMLRLQYLGFILHETANMVDTPEAIVNVGKVPDSKPVYVISTDESTEIARRAMALATN